MTAAAPHRKGHFLASHAYTPRVNPGGNFCGHDPANPRFVLKHPVKTGKGGIPLVISRLMERITQYYERPRKLIPSLDLANGSERQQRSERREACVCMLAALLKYTDLTSLRVGIPTADGFKSMTVEYIAKQTGMTLKRCERAIADLKAAGLLTVSQPRQLLQDGRWVGLAAVKAVSHHLFHVFGLGAMLKYERDKASKRLEKKAKEWQRQKEAEDSKPGTRTGRARFGLFMSTLAGGEKDKKPPKKVPEPPPNQEFKRKKDLTLVAARLKERHPEWNSPQCFAEAERILSGTSMAAK